MLSPSSPHDPLPRTLRGCNAVLWLSAVAVGCSVTALIKAVYSTHTEYNGNLTDFKRPLSVELLLFLAMSFGIPTEIVLRCARGEPWRGAPWKLVLLLGSVVRYRGHRAA